MLNGHPFSKISDSVLSKEMLESTVAVRLLGTLQEVLKHFNKSSILDKGSPVHLEVFTMMLFNSVIL